MRADRSAVLGAALRRWRLLHRVKQTVAADLLGVAQATISRWERGSQSMQPAERARVEALVSARLATAADRVLAGLIEDAARPVHLVCDHTHRLLACSRMRARELGRDSSQLLGKPLLRFATEPLLTVEQGLAARGWYDLAAPEPVVFATGRNRSLLVPIRESVCRWTRLILSDGTAARLVETIDDQAIRSSQSGTSAKRSSCA